MIGLEQPPADEHVARVLEAVRGGVCGFVELHFTDVAGGVKSVVLPAARVPDALADGHWFDGSALEGSARTMETDLMLRPDPATWGILPPGRLEGERVGRLICDVRTPDGGPFPADPRAVLRRAASEAEAMGLRYHASAEVEFYVFLPAHVQTGAGQLTAGIGVPADTGGYFDLPPHGERVRDEMARALAGLAVPVEASHHEIGAGQHEIDLPILPALAAADAVITVKYAVKTVARRHGLLPTFMPKPTADTAGSGLHLHQLLIRADGSNALADRTDEHGLSALGRAFIAGQLAHARAMCAVLAPGVNSYKRIGRGFDAPSHLAWSHSSPYAMVRVPRVFSLRAAGGAASSVGPGGSGESSLRPELRCPDPSCNPYLALAVALAAGLDGIRQGMQLPAEAVPQTGGDAAAPAEVEVLPASLGEAIGELAWDPVVRDALGAPVFERLLAAKEQEWQEYRRQVSPWERDRYFESS